MAAVADILENIDSLPALPTSVMRITAMLSDGTSDLGEIESVARNDEALSMAIMRYGNSALYGRSGKVFNLRESIVRLGGKALLKIVLEQKVAKLFDGAGEAYGLQRGDLWRGAVGGAIAAEAFFTGLFETALEEGEMIVKVTFPVTDCAGYEKFPNPASRYATVGVFVARTKERVRVAVTGAGLSVFRAGDIEAALETDFSPDALDGISISADGLDSDLHASAEYRANLIIVLARRAAAKAKAA